MKSGWLAVTWKASRNLIRLHIWGWSGLMYWSCMNNGEGAVVEKCTWMCSISIMQGCFYKHLHPIFHIRSFLMHMQWQHKDYLRYNRIDDTYSSFIHVFGLFEEVKVLFDSSTVATLDFSTCHCFGLLKCNYYYIMQYYYDDDDVIKPKSCCCQIFPPSSYSLFR